VTLVQLAVYCDADKLLIVSLMNDVQATWEVIIKSISYMYWSWEVYCLATEARTAEYCTGNWYPGVAVETLFSAS